MSHQGLTTFPPDPILDLDPWVGQRQATFRFQRVDGTTGEHLGDIHPIRGATLSHDSTRVIKRLLNMSLGVEDTAAVDVISDRIIPYMLFPNGAEYPLGRFMFTDRSQEVFTTGRIANVTLSDEMFLVDQQIEVGILGTGRNITDLILEIIAPLPVTIDVEASPFLSTENWGLGANRGQILESLSVSGDYFSPWFDHNGVLRFIRTFDPAARIPDFDWDVGNKVVRDGILETDDLLVAPNRFVVISNAATDPSVEAVGTFDIPSTAPHSIANRGFAIPDIQDIQLADAAQAQAVAEGVGQRLTVFERVGISTAPDPRHDGYNVIRWQGEQWLELAWSLSMVSGGFMSHLLRKAYTT